MRALTKDEFNKERAKIIPKLRDCVFIHPTDTVYGIGCNAEKRQLVRKLRSAKEQFSRPMSVIVPSMDWVRENCVIEDHIEEWLDKLPGQYTFILKLKDEDAVAHNVNLNKGTIGVRLPDHWFTKAVRQMKVPVISTSANVTGTNIMTDLDSLDNRIKKSCDYALYEGEKKGIASKVVDLTSPEPEVLRD